VDVVDGSGGCAGVLNPRTEAQISFDEAVSLGIINQRDGTYVNTTTRESMPIQMAMNAGKIKAITYTTSLRVI